METQLLPDGTLQHIAPVSRAIQALPTYGAWLRFLIARGHAAILGTTKTRTGDIVDDIKTVEAHGELLADGRVGIPCLHCGALTCPICGTPGMTVADDCCEGHNLSLGPAERAEARAMLRTRLSAMGRSAINLSLRQVVSGMSRIYIGSRVRMEEIESLGPEEELVKTVGKPVSKAGLACKPCQALYLTAMKDMATENKKREAYNRAIVDIISKDEDTVYRSALAAASKKLVKAQAIEVAMAVLKGHQKSVGKELGSRGATKSLLDHATIDVEDAIKDWSRTGEGA